MKRPVANPEIIDTGIYRTTRRRLSSQSTPAEKQAFWQHLFEQFARDDSESLKKVLLDYEHRARKILEQYGITPVYPFSRPVGTPIIADTAADLFQRIGALRRSLKKRSVSPYVILNAITIGIFADMLQVIPSEPYVKTGRPIKEGGLRGHIMAHGTAEEKTRRWLAYQRDLNTLAEKKPRKSITALRQEVADMHNVKFKTIERRTTNPRKPR